MIFRNFLLKILAVRVHNFVSRYHSQSGWPGALLCILIFFAATAAAQTITVSPPEQNRQSVNVGANVVFTVGAASQSGNVEYHWQYSKNGANFANLQDGDFSGRVSGSRTATLQISNAQLSDTARFRCLVTDPASGPGGPATNSGPGFLTVSTGLAFQITVPAGPPGAVLQNTQAAFTVEITGQSGTLSGVWQFLSDTLRGTFVSLQDGVQSSGSTVAGSTETILHISNVQPGDIGKYRYIVGDTVGTSVSHYNSGPTHLAVTPNPVPGFSIEAPAPPSGSVTQGGSVNTTITVDPINGFSGTVNLSASSLPGGVTATFAQPSLSLPGGNTTTMTLTAASDANVGTATITIIGADTSNTLQDDARYTLTVNASPPVGNPPTISLSPSSTTAVIDNDPVVHPSGIVDSVVFKIQTQGTGPFVYQWLRRQDSSSPWVPVPPDSSQCVNTNITSGPSIICGSTSPELAIFNPQNLAENQGGDQGDYECVVTYASGGPSATSGFAHLSFVLRIGVDEGNPEPQLQYLDALITTKQPEFMTDWQAMVTSDAINRPWSNGENKAVIGAVVGLFYGPRFIVKNNYTGPVMVDYRCWLQSFLNQQTGINASEGVASRYFQNTEFGSLDYTGWVDTAVAAVLLWTNSPAYVAQSQNIPNSCGFDPNALKASAQKYLQDAVAIYGLVAGSGPQSEFIGVTGPTYAQGSNRVPNTPIANTNPQQYMSPFSSSNTNSATKFSVDRSGNPLQSPAIALAGQRTEPGYWAGGDFRAPIVCLALGFSCDTSGEQTGQFSLLQGDPKMNQPGPLAPYLQGLFNSDSQAMAAAASLKRIIADQGTSADFQQVQSVLGSVKVAQAVNLLGWPGGRASCMDSDNINNYRGVVTGLAYWKNGHFFSKGTELDFLYWFSRYGITDGFQTCAVNTSTDPNDHTKLRYELDAVTPDNKIGATIFLPDVNQITFYYELNPKTAGLQNLLGKTAAVTTSPAGGVYNIGQTVALSSTTSGATIYYTTDGSIPDSTSTVYGGPITFNTSGTIDAIASAPGLDDSDRVSATYYLKANPPTFSPAAGTYSVNQSVTLSSSTTGATIYYTTDGSTPTTASTVYNGPFTVSGNTTINAMATAPGFYNSNVAGSTYTFQAAAPVFSPAGGTYSTSPAITLTSVTPGAVIYYAKDGPVSTSSTVYTGPFTLDKPAVINAIATYPGWQTSGVATATYSVPKK